MWWKFIVVFVLAVGIYWLFLYARIRLGAKDEEVMDKNEDGKKGRR